MSNAEGKAKHISIPARRGPWLVLRTVIAVVAVVWVFRGQNWGQLGRIFAGLNPWYFGLSLAIYIAGQALIGLRWWLLLRGQSVFIGLWMAVKLHFLGLFYNNIMPSSIGGDLLRAWYVAKHTDRKLQAVLSVFVDRVLGLSAMTLIAVFCYLVFLRGQQPGPAARNLESFDLAQDRSRISCPWRGVAACVHNRLSVFTAADQVRQGNVGKDLALRVRAWQRAAQGIERCDDCLLPHALDDFGGFVADDLFADLGNYCFLAARIELENFRRREVLLCVFSDSLGCWHIAYQYSGHRSSGRGD